MGSPESSSLNRLILIGPTMDPVIVSTNYIGQSDGLIISMSKKINKCLQNEKRYLYNL